MPVNPIDAYPKVEAVMKRARSYVNDAFNNGAGRILTDKAPFTVEYLNGALEELQDTMRDYGAVTLIRDNYIMTPITPVVKIDSEVQINVSFTGFFDGKLQHALPALPADCLVPITLYERETGSGNDFNPMEQIQNNLPSASQCQSLGIWEWRGGQGADAIWMIGATTTRDLRLRYQGQLVPIAPNTQIETNGEFAPSWDNTQISIQASVEALANLVAYRYARARGPAEAQVFKADAASAIHSILNRYVKQSQGIRYERQPYDRDSDGWRIPGII
jgi:hypothetical protein